MTPTDDPIFAALVARTSGSLRCALERDAAPRVDPEQVDELTGRLHAAGDAAELDAAAIELLELDAEHAPTSMLSHEPEPPLPLPTEEELTEFLRREHPDAAASDIELVPGVSSKEISTFTLSGFRDEPIGAILRRDKPFSGVDTSAAGEFALLGALIEHGLPVARPIAAGTTWEPPLGAPALIMERAPGRPLTLAELGDSAPDVVRQSAEMLGRIHSVPPAGLDVPRRSRASDTPGRVTEMIEEFRDIFMRDRLTPQPTLEVAYAWLLGNAGLVDDTTSLVHADYDLRNLLVDGGEITAVLDWELSHLGHPGEDLGYFRADATQALEWEEFRSAYESAGGRPVDERVVDYFEIWGWCFRLTTVATLARGFVEGRHADVFMTTVCFIEHRLLTERLNAAVQAAIATR